MDRRRGGSFPAPPNGSSRSPRFGILRIRYIKHSAASQAVHLIDEVHQISLISLFLSLHTKERCANQKGGGGGGGG